MFLLPKSESVSRAGGTSTTSRLSFLAGPRLLTHLGTTHSQLTETALTLSCAPPSVPGRVEQVLEDRRAANKRVDALEAELAGMLAERHLAALRAGPATRHEHRTDDSAGALAFLGTVAAAVAAGAPPDQEFLLVLSSSPSAQSAGSTSVVVVVGSDEARVKAVGEGLKGKLSVKGGGKGPRWSGKFTGVWRETKEHAVVAELIGA
jgi:misacylated tRNA(Ala) deacylase